MISSVDLVVVAAVVCGGALGAVGRFLLDRYFAQGVLIANTLGCLILGATYGALDAYQAQMALSLSWTNTIVGLLSVGLTGALTTFATVSLRAVLLWIRGRRVRAVGMWAVHTLCGLVSALLGIWIAALAVAQLV